jgi:AcrR family transcriptional regulator
MMCEARSVTAVSVRARVRAEMTEQIKSTARAHLAIEGANLSLRAVARDVGLVSSAVYRYFPSRDSLLTALIIDAYNALGDEVEAAEAAVGERTDVRGRFLAVATAVRDWAVRNPHEYALLYGSPVPGYRAPQDTIGPASRPVVVLTRILHDAVAAGALTVDRTPPPEPVHSDLQRVLAGLGETAVPEAVLARGIATWAHLFGLVSFELFGRLQGAVENYPEFFEHQVGLELQLLGLAG